MTRARSAELVASLRRDAPWLLAPELSACVVGSAALEQACARAGIAGPVAADVDLAWALDVAQGEALLRAHSVFCATTAANRARGTLACKLGAQRYEITSFRGTPAPGATLAERLALDLSLRDMTVGAVAWRLVDDGIVDPLAGVAAWRARRIVACGDPAQRVREHPVRLLRYYRRAQQWGFDLDQAIRRLRGSDFALSALPGEVIGAEIRAALLHCPSPGRFLLDLHEVGALQLMAPELAPQFDGRPAGPQRHHPEVTQALHLVLALQWAAARTAARAEPDRLALLVAVLVHDLGKNLTPAHEWPAHRGHERAGLPLVEALLDRLPGLSDAPVRRLAHAVCALHLVARDLAAVRAGTQARLYEEWFKWNAFPVELFALAVAADSAGRLGYEHEGERVFADVHAHVTRIREVCASVDAGALWQQHGSDRAAFAAALHEARAHALARSG